MMATDDPQAAMAAFLARLPAGFLTGRSVAIKAKFNSDDPFPASTAPDTLEALLMGLQGAGADRLVLAERSGMGDTAAVLRATSVSALAERLGVGVQIIGGPAGGRLRGVPAGGEQLAARLQARAPLRPL